MPLSAEWTDATGLEPPDRALASLQGCIQTGRLELVAFSGARYRSMLYLENAALPTFFATEEFMAITRDRGTCFGMNGVCVCVCGWMAWHEWSVCVWIEVRALA